MSIKERRKKEVLEMRDLILSTAKKIATEEGFDKISIRKIAKMIDYSPATIYHYFKGKDDILNNILKEGYEKIIDSISIDDLQNLNPEEKLKKMTEQYISSALSMPSEFLAAQINSNSAALQFTSSMFKGASKEKPALKILYNCTKDMPQNNSLSDEEIELKAQIIASSTFGIITKLIIEKDLPKYQKNKLISYYINNTVLKLAK